MDCVVKSWILDSLTDDLAEIVSSQGATARDAWLAVESQFLGNRETRAIQLETKFHNFVQGDLSVIEYCRRLKKMTNDLTALGEVVTDRTLILNVLRGLNKRFTHVGALLRHTRPFPTFLEVKDDLSLEELTLGSHPHHRPLHSPPPPSHHHNRALGTTPAPNLTVATSAAAGVAVVVGAAGAAGQQRLHAAASHCPAAAAAIGWRRQDRQPPPRRLAHRLQPLNGHHTAVVRCPPSSSGAHTSTAAAAAGVRHPTTASAPVVAAAVPASCYSSWRL
jgi:hypothetical protein